MDDSVVRCVCLSRDALSIHKIHNRSIDITYLNMFFYHEKIMDNVVVVVVFFCR